MEGLDYLCICCKRINCDKKQLNIITENKCKTIKCLGFIKDEIKIKQYAYKEK